MDHSLHPDAVARLLVPGLALSGCLHAHLWRDTSAAAGLSEAQRSSWFPATPLCGLSWVLAGAGEQLDEAGRSLGLLPGPLLVTGPRSRPAFYRAHGPTRCFMTAITPDALQALTGLDIAALCDRCVSMEQQPGLNEPDWRALNAAMLAAPDEQACQRLLEDFLRPRWRAVPQAGGSGYRDWMQHLALRAVAAGHGRSLRQMERRIKQWSGQSLRALRALSRAEATYAQGRRAMAEGELVWSALAQDMGYADQAHLCRETRRVTGFSPEELRRRIDSEEAFWPYRVWA
ncbi:AraC family transcriptional regulator [Paucibacter sp. O1-1]|uniref:helix-turn-helix domain-containing protein n=1 Tax=unclassified Roseateles TaxID=2626991 RepID=UPI0021D4C6A8|nr:MULTISPECIES: AraC family transcriptional regulator [unclassified Roseateles]MCU7374174.1 AraC family transcriptional regulator [Paucibacter sp. O1-1]MCZ7882598.1 AraC family transcriptional regulator [Paucibacter sp. M5-1]MDA3829176.1 AraC family transcriptional regulator [Paucibacter sp. O1-1]MDC6170681.1 AraC family transcriptional regulator [Paucibacter sp. XJ19-41]